MSAYEEELSPRKTERFMRHWRAGNCKDRQTDRQTESLPSCDHERMLLYMGCQLRLLLLLEIRVPEQTGQGQTGANTHPHERTHTHAHVHIHTHKLYEDIMLSKVETFMKAGVQAGEAAHTHRPGVLDASAAAFAHTLTVAGHVVSWCFTG